jgi:hypothetical protein
MSDLTNLKSEYELRIRWIPHNSLASDREAIKSYVTALEQENERLLGVLEMAKVALANVTNRTEWVQTTIGGGAGELRKEQL